MGEPLWRPSQTEVQSANMTAFIARARHDWDISASGYHDLYDWSITRPEEFWASLWDFTGIVAEQRGERVLVQPGAMRDARFFPDAKLSFAENLLRQYDDTLAVIFQCEDRIRRTVTRRELYDLTSRIVQALRDAGIQDGDRVCAVLPNIPETLACMLATNSLGAIWSSCSPEFGVRGVVDRFVQVEPKLLFGIDGYFYKGRWFDTTSAVKEICARLPSLERFIRVPYHSAELPRRVTQGSPGTTEAAFWDWIAPFEPGGIPFYRGSFDQPAFILYTSGTTGVPKCILHGAGRVLIQLCKEHWLHFDVKPGDRFYYFTTTGWNMWYTLVTAMAAGATVLMYDGSPFFPEQDTVFDFADREGMTVLGTSPKYIELIKKADLCPYRTHRLADLRSILSTGSPLVPDSFDYVYRNIKPDIRLSSISGGTEIMTTFANGNPIGPVWRGELQVRSLGMRVEIYDEKGRPVRQQKGELVCTAPFPSMPIGFLNDPGDVRYHDTYFSRFADVWCHGDFAELTAHDGLIIYGRSDATLNPGGIRIGTAEIYRSVEEFDEIADSLVVGQNWDNDLRVVLFVKLRDGTALDDDLRDRIRKRIREFTSPRHVPAKIVQIEEIPYTVNGKKVELAVRNVIHGWPVESTSSIANPDALSLYENIPELRT